MNDLISRQAAIDALDVLCQEHRYKIPGKRETYSQYNEAWQDALDRAEGAIGSLPPATPDLSEYSDALWRAAYERGKKEAEAERKRGKWIYNSPVTMKCDQCGLVIKDWDWHRFKYCPNCDSVMIHDGK